MTRRKQTDPSWYQLPTAVRAEISTRVKASLSSKRSRGEYCGGRPPYGYVRAGDDLVPHPIEQTMLCRVQELARSGVTYRTIIEVLEVEGYKTRDGKKFQPGQIARMVHAPVVLG